MITRPDEYKHTNDNYAIVDNDNVRGGIFNIENFDKVSLLLIPSDKRKLNTSVKDGLGLKIYSYFGPDLTDVNWGSLSLWKELNKHVDGFSSKPASPLSGATIISQVAINTNGHVTGVVTRELMPTDIGASASNHIHDNATTTIDGFLSSEDKLKLDGVEDSADANQNAFSNITVNSTTISSTLEEDTFTINSGTGIEITPSGKTITISSTGGYTHPTGFTDAPTTALSGANVISQVNVNTNGHVTGVTSRQLTPVDIGASASNHTHNGLLPTGGTSGQILVKNSSTDYDASFATVYYLNPLSFNNTYNIGTSSPENSILSYLPTDYNLRGKVYTFVFTAGSTYNFINPLNLSSYYNGGIIFKSSSLTTNAIFTFNISSGLSNLQGIINLPKLNTFLSLFAITINLTYDATSSGLCVFFSRSSGANNELNVSNCTFNINCTSGLFNLINTVFIINKTSIKNTTFNITNYSSAYLFAGIDGIVNSQMYTTLNWYLINNISSSNFTDFFNGGVSLYSTFITLFYKNISTLCLSIPTYSTANGYIFNEL